jgi:hypothetical protein
VPRYSNGGGAAVASETDVNAMLRALRNAPPSPNKAGYVIGTRKVNMRGKIVIQRFQIPVMATEALISFLWLFGKNITAILALDRADIIVGYKDPKTDEEGLQVKFRVLMRREKGERKIKFVVYNPARSRYIDMIMAYLKTLPVRECGKCFKPFWDRDSLPAVCDRCSGELVSPRVFPGWTRRPFLTRRIPKSDGSVELRQYENLLVHRMSLQSAHAITHFLRPGMYPTAFHHGVNVLMVQSGKTNKQMREWNDWASSAPAQFYRQALASG